MFVQQETALLHPCLSGGKETLALGPVICSEGTISACQTHPCPPWQVPYIQTTLSGRMLQKRRVEPGSFFLLNAFPFLLGQDIWTGHLFSRSLAREKIKCLWTYHDLERLGSWVPVHTRQDFWPREKPLVLTQKQERQVLLLDCHWGLQQTVPAIHAAWDYAHHRMI